MTCRPATDWNALRDEAHRMELQCQERANAVNQQRKQMKELIAKNSANECAEIQNKKTILLLQCELDAIETKIKQSQVYIPFIFFLIASFFKSICIINEQNEAQNEELNTLRASQQKQRQITWIKKKIHSLSKQNDMLQTQNKLKLQQIEKMEKKKQAQAEALDAWIQKQRGMNLKVDKMKQECKKSFAFLFISSIRVHIAYKKIAFEKSILSEIASYKHKQIEMKRNRQIHDEDVKMLQMELSELQKINKSNAEFIKMQNKQIEQLTEFKREYERKTHSKKEEEQTENDPMSEDDDDDLVLDGIQTDDGNQKQNEAQTQMDENEDSEMKSVQSEMMMVNQGKMEETDNVSKENIETASTEPDEEIEELIKTKRSIDSIINHSLSENEMGRNALSDSPRSILADNKNKAQSEPLNVEEMELSIFPYFGQRTPSTSECMIPEDLFFERIETNAGTQSELVDLNHSGRERRDSLDFDINHETP